MNRIYKSPEGERLVRERYLAFLKHWPAPHQQIRIPTSQGETFVVASGSEGAPALVLLHGSAGNSAMWMGEIRAFAEHFRVYAIDMIGEAGLSAPSRPELSSDAHALWIDDVLRGLALERVSDHRPVPRRLAGPGLRDAAPGESRTGRCSLPGRGWTAKGRHPVRDDRAPDVRLVGKAQIVGNNTGAPSGRSDSSGKGVHEFRAAHS